ncbi:YkvA family protein [Pseudolysinimonas sp.]|uniref:YkvA family protein n=1 Tax=Pseudolysinimonas sp. TaxID=2680009 RepID=UPI003F7EAFB8
MEWWAIPVAVVGGLLLLWVALVAALLIASRRSGDRTTLRDALRLVPDVVRLLRRLVADRAVPRRVRVGLTLLLIYLVLPIDLIPDFIPVVGYLDDAIIVAIVLRYVTRAAGADALDRLWPGTPEGLAALRRICGVAPG